MPPLDKIPTSSAPNPPESSRSGIGDRVLEVVSAPLAVIASVAWFVNSTLFADVDARVRREVRKGKSDALWAATTFFRMFGYIDGYQDYISRLAARNDEQRWVAKVVIGTKYIYEVTLSIPVRITLRSVLIAGKIEYRIIAGSLMDSKGYNYGQVKPKEFQDDPKGLQLLVSQEKWRGWVTDTSPVPEKATEIPEKATEIPEKTAEIQLFVDELRQHRAPSSI